MSTSGKQDQKRQDLGDDPQARERFTRWLQDAPDEAIMELREVPVPEPDFARIHEAVPCAVCGELVMETRVRVVNGEKMCIPCAGIDQS